jgi:hypothetical protein
MMAGLAGGRIGHAGDPAVILATDSGADPPLSGTLRENVRTVARANELHGVTQHL